MRLIYNGIDLGVIETDLFESVPVYDETGTDYLYTRHTITVKAMVNGQVELTNGPGPGGFLNGPPMSYKRTTSNELRGGGGGGAPPGMPGNVSTGGGDPWPASSNSASVPPGIAPGNTAPPAVGGPYLPPNQVVAANAAGFFGATPSADGVFAGTQATEAGFQFVTNPAPLTWADINRRLTIPNGQLLVFSGPGVTDQVGGTNYLMLQSPAFGARVDCNNGPKPRVLGVEQVNGDYTTFQVYFTVETATNDVVADGTFQPAAVLSNRFRQTHVLNADSYLSIVTEGTAVFRTDWVYGGGPEKVGISPDSLRPYLFQPIPLGFVRWPIEVSGLPDVCGVRYSYTDTQQPQNFVAGPFVRASTIVALHRQAAITDPQILSSVFGTYERILGMQANKHIAQGSSGVPEVPARTYQPRAKPGAPGLGSAIQVPGAQPHK